MFMSHSIARAFKVTLLSAVISVSLTACADKEDSEKEAAAPVAVKLTKITGLKTPE